ncbi:unnamed protein product [Rhizoctonia solani]|uniref:Myb-like domain-containing protein n=1 Tax=Rhizoctonia solani TaxID=456999 RepID=A0A8H3DMW1_9AGAM|nr:unnamed protein product [Rhizoctonia solani]
MEPIIAENNVANISNSEVSIAELEKFIEAQRSALSRIQHEGKHLEALKLQAVAQPDVVMGDILAGKHDALKFSNTSLGLAANVPEIDWTLLEANDLKPVIHARPSETGSSRVDKMRKHISDFHQTLAQLAPIPAEFLGNEGRDTEERGKKRRRVDSVPRAPTAPPSSSLRLPYPAQSRDNVRLHSSSSMRIIQPPAPGHSRTWSPDTTPDTTGGQDSTKPLNEISQPHTDYSYPQPQSQAFKGANSGTHVRHESPSPASPDAPPTPIQPATNSPVALAAEESTAELPDAGEAHSTFKQNWTLAEQHTLERLLVEIPSTVKFRWVKISEAMGGTRTPRQVASRVQKYYEKMKKLGVAVNSADMGGGGRGGSKATQTLDALSSMRTRGPSTRGKPKTGPQYTKSGRRR